MSTSSARDSDIVYRADPQDSAVRYAWSIKWVLYILAAVMTVYVPVVVIGVRNLPPLTLVVVAALIAAYPLAGRPTSRKLPRWRTVTILAVVAFANIAVVWTADYSGSLTAPSGWQLSPSDLLLFCLVLRRRFVAAWVGQLIVQLVYAAWSMVNAGSPLPGLAFTYGQALPLAAVTLFALGLHGTVRRITSRRAATRERAEHEAREAAADSQLGRDLDVVRRLAGPTLEAIAAGHHPDRDEVRGLEAALRDLIRGRNLTREPLVTALREARERGVDIVVLDDSGERDVSEADARVLARWAAEQVAAAIGHDMTLRLTFEDERPLVTFTVDGHPAGRLHV